MIRCGGKWGVLSGRSELDRGRCAGGSRVDTERRRGRGAGALSQGKREERALEG